MSHITVAQQGIAAAEAREWSESISKLSQALKSSTNPTWLLTRSKALVNTGRFQEALDDANLAWHTAYQRNARPALVDAHYRRAVAYYRLGQHANADACCLYSMRLIKGHSALEKPDPAGQWTDDSGFWTATLADATAEAQSDDINGRKDGGIAMTMSGQAPPQAKEWRAASTLRMQILGSMARLPEDDVARKRTVSLKPEEKALADIKVPEKDKKAAADPVPDAGEFKLRPLIVTDMPMRLQHFQSNTTMSVSILSKGADKEKLQVEFLPSRVRLDPLKHPSGDVEEYILELWGEIDISSSKFTVTPNKVELSLTKKTPGKWPQLEKNPYEEFVSPAAKVKVQPDVKGKAPEASPAVPEGPADAVSAPEDKPEIKSAASGPSYPTSSRTGPKNWDKIGDDEIGDDKPEGDVNLFFKSLYKGATPEQQRAMMKSFTESNGTSLSTDWNDVKDRTVKTVPPEGVEAKKWE